MNQTTTEATPLPIVIIGLGNQGREHLRVCLAHPELVTVTAIVDGAIENIRKNDTLALPSDCQFFKSTEELPQGLVRAAIVATPPFCYKVLLPSLMTSDLHLLVEKPLGMDLSEAAQLLALAKENKIVLIPAVQRRFHESYRDVRHVLSNMGHVHQASLTLKLDKTPDNWREQSRIGSLVDLGFHALDLARDLFGDLHLLSSTLFDRQGNLCRNRTDAAAHLLFRTESGTFLRLISKGGQAEKCEYFHAYSHTQHLIADREGWKLYQHEKLIREQPSPRGWDNAMLEQLQLFARACTSENSTTPDSSAKFGFITMKLLEEIYTRATYF